VSGTRITGRAAQAATGIVVSTVFAWLAVRHVRLDQVTSALSHARWRWLVPATALLLLSVAFRAVRWSVMFPARLLLGDQHRLSRQRPAAVPRRRVDPRDGAVEGHGHADRTGPRHDPA
jgi:hypothetical protein